DLDASQALSSLTGGVAGTASGLTGLFTGVGKSLVSGSLDVLETLGKKTFETLTVSEQGAKGKPGKRRLIFQKERPNLSKVLRELKTQVDVDAKSQQEEEEARLANFVYLFEKNEGMVHLEGLEMLSESCSRQVESALISGIDQETLDQLDVVRDMYDGLTDEESLSETADVPFESEIKNYLKRIGLAYNPAKLLETDKRLFDWLYDCQTTQDLGEMKEPRDLHRQAIRSLAEFAARCVETLHKLAQLMLVAGSAPEAKPFFDLTLVFCAEIGVIAAKFSTCLNSAADDVDDPSSVSAYLTSLFLEANNSTNYLREALRLLRPVLERAIILERNTSVA
uniref:Uncharacterized protein n=1 Tax=Plectus sambesii TaxID=2011161 RepID=A0A914WMR3_9BILA